MFVVYASPFLRSDTTLFLDAILELGVGLGVISQDPLETLPESYHSRLSHWRVADPLNSDQLTWAATELQNQNGRIERILAVNEQSQVPVAEVRSRLDVPGMWPETVLNFRYKARMKERLRAHGLPCARHCAATDEQQAWEFVAHVGFPVCVKPVDGAAAQSTYKVESEEAFAGVLRLMELSWGHPLQIEEFVVGDEHSFETMSSRGRPLWHSLTRYLPTPLEVMRNPWIQWRMILPREIDSPQYDDVRDVGRRALQALGMETGMSHMEWFRRRDGSIAIGEIGGRPPGTQIFTMMNWAHDADLYRGWCRLMITDQWDPPTERKYAAGTAYLRGLGGGHVKAVHGLDHVLRELGDMVVECKHPEPGQPSGNSYEGQGYVMLRHPETRVVEESLEFVINNVRVELI